MGSSLYIELRDKKMFCEASFCLEKYSVFRRREKRTLDRILLCTCEMYNFTELNAYSREDAVCFRPVHVNNFNTLKETAVEH